MRTLATLFVSSAAASAAGSSSKRKKNFIAETPILKMSPTPQSSASVRSEKSEESILGRPSTREISAWSAGSICSATCRSVSAGAKLRILYPGQRAAGPRVAATLSKTIVISVGAGVGQQRYLLCMLSAISFARLGAETIVRIGITLRSNDSASVLHSSDSVRINHSHRILSEAGI